MKRIVLMVMLLVAGALALVYLVLWGDSLLSLVTLLRTVWGSHGSGRIGSVSGGFGGELVLLGPMLFSSFLLWRACANLAAGGDPVMAWHRKFHGAALIAGPLFVALVIVLFGIALEVLGFTVMAALPLAFFGLSAVQLYTAVVAFRTLVRRGRHAS